LVDIKAVSNTIIKGLKQKIFGKSSYGNKDWTKANHKWYEEIHNSNNLLHTNFIEYFNQLKPNIQSVLEVGCGTGVYPIKHEHMFQNLDYTGIDFSETNIEYCKTNSKFNFKNGDFIKMEIKEQFDLVFSHAVIDHVYNIDIFLTNLIKSCKKYAYINSYRGFFPDINKHEMKWRDEDNCYYNNISIKQIKKVLLANGLSEKEFIIRKQKSGQTQKDLEAQLVIEIIRDSKN
jgi:2-polyprenyl-3-methyl-5-hydroxy-6-metoxy-1,4-benzoquinol methylase